LIVRAHEVAGVDHECASTAGDRGANRGVLQLDFGILDRSAVGAHRGVEGGGGCARRIALLACADAAFDEVIHALRDHFRVRGLRGVAREIRFGLIQCGFERAMVEREEHLTGLNVIALIEIDVFQLARDLSSDGYRRKCLGRSDDIDIERHDFLDNVIDRDGYCGLRCACVGTLSVAGRTGGKRDADRDEQADGQAIVMMHWGKLHFNEYEARLNSLNSADTIL